MESREYFRVDLPIGSLRATMWRMKKIAFTLIVTFLLSLGFFMVHEMNMASPALHGAASSSCPFMGEMKICAMSATQYVQWFASKLPDSAKIFIAAFLVLFFGKKIFDDALGWKRPVRKKLNPALVFLTKIHPRLYA